MIDALSVKRFAISQTILDTLAELGTVLSKLEEAYEIVTELADSIQGDSIYQGNGSEDIEHFFILYISHLESLIRLYAKAYQFAAQNMSQFLVLDEEMGNMLGVQ